MIMRGRTALKIVRRIREQPELQTSYAPVTVRRALCTVYRRKRYMSWIKTHVRIRFDNRTAVQMPDRTLCFILNEEFDTL